HARGLHPAERLPAVGDTATGPPVAHDQRQSSAVHRWHDPRPSTSTMRDNSSSTKAKRFAACGCWTTRRIGRSWSNAWQVETNHEDREGRSRRWIVRRRSDAVLLGRLCGRLERERRYRSSPPFWRLV